MNKEFIEYHQQSQDNVKNYFETRNQPASTSQATTSTAAAASMMMSTSESEESPVKLAQKELPAVRKLFESDQTTAGGDAKPKSSSSSSTLTSKTTVKTADDNAASKEINENLMKLEDDLVKNLTDMVLKSKPAFNKGGPPSTAATSVQPTAFSGAGDSNQVPHSLPKPPSSSSTATNVSERPPILWVYLDPVGQVKILY